MFHVSLENASSVPPTLLQVAADIADTVERSNIQSLSELTKPTRVCPVCYVDKSLTYAADDSITNILQTMLAIYTAHYLQAVSLIQNINGVNTLKLLDSVSTNQQLKASEVASGLNTWADVVGMNSYKLPDYSKLRPTLEAAKGGNLTDTLNSQVNMAIGRVVEVVFKTGEKSSINVLVNVLLSPILVSQDTLPNLMMLAGEDQSYVGRFHKWRAGEIESFVDYALALDIIERDRKALLTDETGLYRKAREDKTKGFLKSLITRNHRYNIASAMSLISKATAENIELILKGRLSSERTRDLYFKTTGSMMLVVADPTAERVVIYQRGISEFGVYTYSDLKQYGKKTGGGEIESILKAYKLGERPSL